MKPLRLVLFVALTISLSACSLPFGNQNEPSAVPTLAIPKPTMEQQVTPTVAATDEPQEPTYTIPDPERPPEWTETPTVFTPFNVSVWAEGVKLRVNPGYLFPALRLISRDVRLQVLGRSPGNEWIYVLGPNDTYGWVFAQLIERDVDLNQAPLVEPGNVQLLRGSLTTPDGLPISGVQFAITQGDQRTDAMTNEQGEFFAFMPLEVGGTWQVSYTAIACTSNAMDEDCNCLGGYCGMPDPQVTSVTLPTEDVLQFTWQ